MAYDPIIRLHRYDYTASADVQISHTSPSAEIVFTTAVEAILQEESWASRRCR